MPLIIAMELCPFGGLRGFIEVGPPSSPKEGERCCLFVVCFSFVRRSSSWCYLLLFVVCLLYILVVVVVVGKFQSRNESSVYTAA